MNVILDASAVLAGLKNEPGAELFWKRSVGSRICSVNLAEVVSKLIDIGSKPEIAVEDVAALRLDVVSFDADTALLAGRLRTDTRHRGLSLGDRACLALAIREKATALTADRNWADLDLPCKVELIR
ncbi:type II toxin-antitoxin system VapC family toxin [Hoeflea ulvae]|uniref:Type II toxin-antitoxin system VapC family toxin n=1 Tax=Hoeflea ulvae TaxID=2983764 RepID=A0ABT3YJY6_9HYPH|nr:type II toxin-antitoxin system VapC family toxin [Hoeflea ulvae]MCY0095942.1 type II toxin-antitoxin system VapC family toxin [Hoeflea ulvae]